MHSSYHCAPFDPAVVHQSMRCACHHLREFRCGMDTHAESTAFSRAAILLASNGLAGADPDVLWRIVNDQCVPHQRTSDDPAPCALVNQDGDFALLKDIDGAAQYLLIPTERISGIETPDTARAGCHQLLRGGMAGALARRGAARTHRAARLAEPCGQLRVRAVAESAPHPHRLSPCRCARRAVTAHRRYRTGMDAVPGAARGRPLQRDRGRRRGPWRSQPVRSCWPTVCRGRAKIWGAERWWSWARICVTVGPASSCSPDWWIRRPAIRGGG